MLKSNIKDFVCTIFRQDKNFIKKYNYILAFLIYSVLFGIIIATKSTSHFDFIIQKYMSGIIVFMLYFTIQILIKSAIFFVLSKCVAKSNETLIYCVRLLTLYTIYTNTFCYAIKKAFEQYPALYMVTLGVMTAYFGIVLLKYLELNKLSVKSIITYAVCCGITLI